MPHKQKHRGAHPKDPQLFSPTQVLRMREAVSDVSYLLTRDYPLSASMKLVGDKFRFTERQRQAVQHSVCSAQAREYRNQNRLEVSQLGQQQVIIDGYNQLIAIECALSGAPLFIGLDGCFRDIASIHSTYRKVEETVPALGLIGQVLQNAGVEKAVWVLDRPVSNSGRLKVLMDETAQEKGWNWDIILEYNPDRYIAAHEGVALSSDSWVLDNGKRWVNLTSFLVEHFIKEAWVMDLR